MGGAHLTVAWPALTTVITLAVLGAFVISSVRQTSSVQLLDKNMTNSLRGLAVIGVVLVHVYLSANLEPQRVPLLSGWGHLGVAWFLFLSGFGLMRSRHLEKLSLELSNSQGLWVSVASLMLLLMLGMGGLANSALALAFLCLWALVVYTLWLRGCSHTARFLAKRFLRVFVLVLLIGAFNYVMTVLIAHESVTLRHTVATLLGLSEWYIKWALFWYVVLALAATSASRRVSMVVIWAAGVLAAVAVTFAGGVYTPMWALCFPLGASVGLMGNLDGLAASRVATAAAGVVLLGGFVLPVVLSITDFGRYAPYISPFNANMDNAALQASRWSYMLPRLVPSIGATACMMAVAVFATRFSLRAPVLEGLGRISLPIYLLNLAMITKYDVIVWRGPVVLSQWAYYLVLVMLAVLFQRLDEGIQARLRSISLIGEKGGVTKPGTASVEQSLSDEPPV